MNRLSLAAAALAATFALPLTSAQAQFAWPWTPELNSVEDKVTVRFPLKHSPGDIVVSFGDRRLYHVISPGRAISYPITVPRAQSRWQGTQRVTRKRENPSWTPTASMRRENPKLPASVPGGHPRNPMGVRALYLGSTLYRIHGTDAPWTIGKNVSKGCVRMHNEHVIELYERVRVGAKVLATWKQYRAPRAS
jgi:lipoprotein-anchoring transpeptidase ErfK/SrfK